MTGLKDQPDEYWRRKLAPEQYRILREKDTETPFTGELLKNKKTGMYVCAACGQPLFSSEAKFDSGSGWPSFYDVVNQGNVELKEDLRYGMRRTEIVCANCGGHLGHMFLGDYTPTGEYYCINSACLSFKPKGKE